jgi:hypothetical protein
MDYQWWFTNHTTGSLQWGGGDNGIGNVTKAAEGNLPKDTNDDINKLPLLDLMIKNPWPSSPDA